MYSPLIFLYGTCPDVDSHDAGLAPKTPPSTSQKSAPGPPKVSCRGDTSDVRSYPRTCQHVIVSTGND